MDADIILLNQNGVYMKTNIEEINIESLEKRQKTISIFTLVCEYDKYKKDSNKRHYDRQMLLKKTIDFEKTVNFYS